MRALILSDIHANIDALNAVLDLAPAHDVVWDLGDVVGYGAAPNESVDTIRKLGTVHVRGNHDRVCCGIASSDSFNAVAYKAVQWTRTALSEDSIAWLSNMAQGPIMPDGPDVSCVHGSPLDEDDYVIGISDAAAPLLYSQTRITFFGHTHLQGCFSLGEDGWSQPLPRLPRGNEVARFTLQINPATRYLVNPGSVGQPRDDDWRAGFALYDDTAMTIDFHRVPYDIESAQKKIRDAGLPGRLASRLAEGR